MADNIVMEQSPAQLELDESKICESKRLEDTCSSFGRNHTTSETEPAIANRETRAILGIKILFVLVLCMSAAGALGVYFYISGRENSEFEAQFRDDAIKVLAAVGATIDFSLGAADSFVTGIISTAEVMNQT